MLHSSTAMRAGIVGLALSSAFYPAVAFAHAFGQQYTLPLPAHFYIIGGSVVLVLSFALLFFLPAYKGIYKEKQILSGTYSTTLFNVLRALSVLILLVTIGIGLWGSQTPAESLTPYLFWIGLLLGFAYLSIFVQGVWERVNPFVFEIPFLRHIAPTETLAPPLHHLPAVVLYGVLLWIELLSGGVSAVPKYIAIGVVCYALYAWFIIDRYGKEIWNKHFDVFGVFFRLLGFLAPIVVRDDGVYLRTPRIKTHELFVPSLGLTLFIIAILAFTAFDGFRETVIYVQTFITFFSVVPYSVIELLMFVFFPILFFATYALCIYAVQRIGKTEQPYRALLGTYAYSLIPIAVVYHVAHYFSLFLVEGQRIIQLVSDPFALGWNLFGTKDYVVNLGIIGADTVWYFQVVIIVAGHILALYLSHTTTRTLIPERIRAMYAELPLLGVMVLYTAFGLWILSQPFAL